MELAWSNVSTKVCGFTRIHFTMLNQLKEKGNPNTKTPIYCEIFIQIEKNSIHVSQISAVCIGVP